MTKGDDTHFTTREVLEFTGATPGVRYSESWLRALEKAGHVPPCKDGLWPWPETIFAIFQYLKRKGATSPLSAEKCRTEKHRGDLLRVSVLRQQGKLVLLKEAEHGWSDLVLSFRTKVMALPSKLSPLIVGKKTPAEVQALLDAEMRQCLEELSKPVEYSQPDQDELDAINEALESAKEDDEPATSQDP